MKRSLIIVILSVLSGCGPLIPIPGESPKRFNLSAIPVEQRAQPSPLQLIVDIPTTSVFLDTQRVAVVPAPQQIDYFANMEWAERLQLVVQESVTYSLQNLNLFRAVTRQNDGIIPDRQLKINIRKFQVNLCTQPIAEAEYYVQLINVISRDEVARYTFTTSIPMSAESTPSAEDIAAALDQANKNIIGEIADWLKKYL
ncbi:MAG: membrane integrity-associated transporter subunit PqiC [Candidatus Paracaedibacteraceae bacterium]|jgi:ABC-type uncharacterized transport system auxiliary subunit|nr:membrane integrity-associated transporter subunit PqiC [Candidatus Paracaedibacteraceae bacterium]